jgi:hypothetical protein
MITVEAYIDLMATTMAIHQQDGEGAGEDEFEEGG